MTRVIVEFVEEEEEGDVIDVDIFSEEGDEATDVERKIAEDFAREFRNELFNDEVSGK